MGKHERESIDEAEKVIVDIINKKHISSSVAASHWYPHAVKIAAAIRAYYRGLVSAKHWGNNYDYVGDIGLSLPGGGWEFIEAKMSEDATSRGTKANISQNALTAYGLFVGMPVSWTGFRIKKGHDEWVGQLLDSFDGYPMEILNIVKTHQRREAQARYLRGLNQHSAKEIMKLIADRDHDEKVEYLKYLSKQKQDSEHIKRFYALIALGVHKAEKIKALISKNNMLAEAQSLVVYRTNVVDRKIVVRRENAGLELGALLKTSKSFELEFPEEISSCYLIRRTLGGVKEKLLTITLHWKNVAQGIKTPCLNIFDTERSGAAE